MAFALILLFFFVSQLEQVLNARGDLTAAPFSGMGARRETLPSVGIMGTVVAMLDAVMMWLKEKLELWTASQDDKRLAWTLGIGWACCGGGLAGGCLVFAKAA